MTQSFYGSIDFDCLMEGLKTGQLKTFKTEKGRRYININIYLQDQPDQYGRSGSVSVPLKDDFQTDNMKRLYIGNLKKTEPKIKEATGQDFQQEDDDLPF